MNRLLKLAMIALCVLVAACEGTTTVTNTYQNQSTSPRGTSSNSGSSETKVTRKGWPVGIAWGYPVAYGYPGVVGSTFYPAPGTGVAPDGSLVCPNPSVRISGQRDCGVWGSDLLTTRW